MKLLDTTFLIHYWGGLDEVAEYLETHEESAFATTTLNLKEIAVGRTLQGKFDRHEINSTFGWLTVVPFDVEHAYLAAELEAKLHRDSETNRDRINSLTADVLIAAIAKELDATVVTRNVEDFETFDGVSVESY